MERKFASLETTNKLLFLLVIPMIVLVMKELSSIFIPLILASFFVLLFMPVVRWTSRRSIPRWVAILAIVCIFSIVAYCCVLILQVTSREFRTTDAQTWQQLFSNFNDFVVQVLLTLGIDPELFLDHVKDFDIVTVLYENIGQVLNAVRNTGSMLFLSFFFMILLVATSFNAQKLLQVTLFKNRMPSVRTYVTIERSISKFILVKFLISFATGLAFSVLCWCYDIKFAIFWGVLAFVLNFIQMIGSIISTALLCLFALTQLSTMSAILIFIVLTITIQLIFGSVLEPIFMGKTFSINTVVIIVMLFFWGYVWGIMGMILAVPLTVMIKTIMEQFSKTKDLAQIMS